MNGSQTSNAPAAGKVPPARPDNWLTGQKRKPMNDKHPMNFPETVIAGVHAAVASTLPCEAVPVRGALRLLLSDQHTPIRALVTCSLYPAQPGIDAGTAALVGDSVEDAEAAASNGVHFVAATYGYGAPLAFTEAAPAATNTVPRPVASKQRSG